jgi:hypothetical protein
MFSLGLIEATRRADSTTQVLAGVLLELRTQFACDWAMIFVRASGERATTPEASFACLAANPEDLACKTIPAHGYLLGRLRFQILLTFGEDEFDTVLRWAAEQRNPRIAEVKYLKQLGTRAALSLWAKNEITGILLFGSPVERKEYSAESPVAVSSYRLGRAHRAILRAHSRTERGRHFRRDVPGARV